MKNSSTVLAGIVSLILLAVALILGVSATGSADKATPLIAQVFGWIALIIPVLIGTLKAESLHRDVRNGELAKRNVQPAMKNILADDETLEPLVAKLVERINEPTSDEPWDGKERRAT